MQEAITNLRQRWTRDFQRLVAILCIVMLMSQLLSAQDVPTMNGTELATQIQTFVENLTANDQFSGAVLVSKDGQTIFQGAYGLASKAFNVPNQLDTKFNLGSMNKMITSVAIAQLGEAGKLSYDDTIGEHLTDYPNEDVASKVTIHHLLTHTSGLPDYFNDTFVDFSREKYRSVRDFFALFADKPLEFTPGATWSYSNSNFIVLGAIIEAVSGETYFDYVREHIYEPLGMTNTDAYEMDYDTPNLAMGYTRAPEGGWKNNLFMHVIKGGPAGGGFSTVEDLTRFARALLEHTLLSAESTEFITSSKITVRGAGAASYAYGFIDENVNGHRRFGHGGGFEGINGQLHVYPDLGYIVVVLANYDPPAAEIIADRVGRWITGSEVPKAMDMTLEQLSKYVHVYTGTGPSLETVVDNGALWLVMGDERHKFLPLSETEFFDEQFMDIRMKFVLDEEGNVTEMTLEGAGPQPETFTPKD
jgi:D-alanyl-D-alanine carboxypeptidase